MRKNIIQSIILNSLVAAIYIVTSLPFGQLNFGPINIRIGEILLLLVLINFRFSYGLILGCFVLNLFSDIPLDIVFGTLQTVIACILLKYIKIKFLAITLAAVSCGVIVGLEVSLYYNLPIPFTMATIFLSEYIILIVGYLIYKYYLIDSKLSKKLIETI